MPVFLVYAQDGPQGLERRPAARPDHLRHWRALAEQGRLLFAGPLQDRPEGEPRGSLILFEAEDRQAAEALMSADPYVAAGVFEKMELRATKKVLPE